MAQHTAQNFETSNCRQIEHGNPNITQQIQIFMLIQKQRFVDTLYGHKNTVPRIRFVNHIKTLLE